jgi:hypothetical protein
LDDLAKRTGFELEDLESCINELMDKGLIRYKRGSREGKHTKPKWTIPLARPNLTKGNWTPVPRFIAQKYIPAYPDSVLLLPLLLYQNLYRKNEVFTGIPKLSKHLGWSERRVRRSLSTMSDRLLWEKLRTGLKRPLTREVRLVKKSQLEHYHVRAVVYEETDEEVPIVRIARTFARKFKIPHS